MLFLLVSSLSFLLFLSKPLPLKIFPSWINEMGLLSLLLCQEFLYYSFQFVKNCLKFPFKMPVNRNRWLRIQNAVVEEEEEAVAGMTVLDLPELALEHILGKLSPAGLCNMRSVCRSLRDRCRSDHIWERHMREKWGRVIGQVALREWELASKKEMSGTIIEGFGRINWWVEPLSFVLHCSWLKPKQDCGIEPRKTLRSDSIMARYLSLESGRFWFPAQVYNREQNEHVGFMLSCYDAELSYDSQTDTFHARYPPHGQRPTCIEEGVEWDRIRVPPVDTPSHELHVTDCLKDLRPGDHIEIQWRRNKGFPYGWWYGIVGHLESCDEVEYHCHCHSSDTIILVFNQYTPGSRWRQTIINRKDHREEGNETDGFYAGIRKLYKEDEISMWKRSWPTEDLE